MSESFFLFHTTEHSKLERYRGLADWSLGTCLRSLVLFSSSKLPAELQGDFLPLGHAASVAPGAVAESLARPDGGIDVYLDEKAYGFILEIVCGLHSPIVGETEVMGQFRASLQTLAKDSPVKSFLQSVLTDAKKIRTEHLSGMGSQSYGSLCRRELQGLEAVHLLGAGKLTKDLLPWFNEFPKVEVYCRSVKRGESLKTAHPKVGVYPWNTELNDDRHDRSALVIAAPITESELAAWMDVHGHDFEKIIDLRAETESERAAASILVEPSGYANPVTRVGLTQLFASVKSNKEELHHRVTQVKNEIGILVQKKANRVQIRPLGWDEICA